MNALVAVRANATGLNNITPEKRAAAAEQVAATARVKEQAYLAKAGLVAKSSESTGTREVKKELDRNAFLQLLVLQMQNQDPLSPTDNTEMIAQLAQFSALEQMNNLNTNFETLSGSFNQLSFISAGTLIGKTVAGTDDAGQLKEGTVDKVLFDSGKVYVSIGGTLVPMANIQRVE